jgi:hypothetical protein
LGGAARDGDWFQAKLSISALDAALAKASIVVRSKIDIFLIIARVRRYCRSLIPLDANRLHVRTRLNPTGAEVDANGKTYATNVCNSGATVNICAEASESDGARETPW